ALFESGLLDIQAGLRRGLLGLLERLADQVRDGHLGAGRSGCVRPAEDLRQEQPGERENRDGGDGGDPQPRTGTGALLVYLLVDDRGPPGASAWAAGGRRARVGVAGIVDSRIRVGSR